MESGRIVRVVHPRAGIRWEPLSSAPSDLTVEITAKQGKDVPQVWVLTIVDPDDEQHVVFIDDGARRALIAKMTNVVLT